MYTCYNPLRSGSYAYDKPTLQNIVARSEVIMRLCLVNSVAGPACAERYKERKEFCSDLTQMEAVTRRRCCAFQYSPKQARAAVEWALPIVLRGGKNGGTQRSPRCHQSHCRCIQLSGSVHIAPQQPGHEEHPMPEDPVLHVLYRYSVQYSRDHATNIVQCCDRMTYVHLRTW